MPDCRVSKNTLLRAMEVQKIYKEHQANGATNEWIYDTQVFPRFYISRSTFYKYLSIPAARELRRIEEHYEY